MSIVVSVVCAVPVAHAQDGQAYEELLPPAPRDRRAVRGVETRVHLPIPAYVRPLCPAATDCILGVGGGFAVFVERRLQSGFSLGVGYELHLHAAESVYELTTIQSVAFRARWVFNKEGAGHPTLNLGAGLATLGDTFRVETAGIVATAGVGGELEMSSSLAFTAGIDFRLLAFLPFSTDLDDVRRSRSPYLNVVPVLHVGVLWLAPRVRAR